MMARSSGADNAVSQQITKFKPSELYAPQNLSTFFHADVQQRWIKLVPSEILKND